MSIDRHITGAALAVVAMAAVAACGARTDVGDGPPRSQASAPARSPESHPAAARGAAPPRSRPRIVFLGDSLTAGLGLAATEAYPALIQQRLDAASLDYEVVNAGVSGDTSAGGLARLDWALDGDVRILVVALGGNDGLRGLPAEELRKNLQAIIERAHERRIKVVLAGMEAPPNFGAQYVAEFRRTYSDLAKQYHAAFVPFLLQGVAGIESLNQRDGIHPTPEGARLVADNVWKALEPLVAEHVESK